MNDPISVISIIDGCLILISDLVKTSLNSRLLESISKGVGSKYVSTLRRTVSIVLGANDVVTYSSR